MFSCIKFGMADVASSFPAAVVAPCCFTHSLVFPFASNVNLIFMPVAPLIFLSRIYSLTEQILVWYLQSHIGFCPIFVK